MTAAELREALIALTREVGIEVRLAPAPPAGEGATGAASGTCLLRGRRFVVLASGEPAEAHVAVLARALRAHAPHLLADRFLPPAVRAHLEPESEA